MNPMSTTEGQVDQILGSAYQVIKYVAANMETLISLAESVDPLVNSMQTAFEALKRTYAEAGFDLLKASFKTGAAIGNRNHVLIDDNTGIAYSWGGALPHFVPKDSTVESSGGVGQYSWIPQDSSSLRQALASSNGVSLVGGAASSASLNLLTAEVSNLRSSTGVNTRESQRRSYAEAGYNLVDDSFEMGGTVSAITDVLLFEAEGKAYSYMGSLPHTAAQGSSPSAEPGMWVDRSGVLYSDKIASSGGASLSLSQVATAYGIPFSSLFVWTAGLVSDTSKYWWHNNKVWQSNADDHILEAAPIFATAHIVPVDGVLYPDHFGASYIPGTDHTPAIQRCEDWQKARNAALRLRSVEHTLLTKLVISRAPCIIAEAGGYGVTTASPASSQRRPQGAVLVGKVAGDFSVEVSPAAFEFGGQIENVTVTGKEFIGAAKTAGKGVRLHNFGWSGRVKGLSILDFDGKGLEIGYLQDTVVDQLTILGCGPTSAQRSLSFTSNSNYIYFNNAHIEDGNYLLGCAEAVDKPWEIHWNGCHFESGDYDGALGPEFDHSYTTEPVEFDGCYRWYWNDATMVPASVQRLQGVNGGDSASQPYFMRGLNTSRICGDTVRFICPRDSGGIDAMQLTGDFSGNVWSNVHIEGAQGAKYCVNMESGSLVGGSMSFTVGSEVKMFGINVNRGFIDKIRFANNPGGAVKTAGYLINSYVQAGLTSGQHQYDMGTAPFKWLNQYVISTDERVNDYHTLVNGETLDLEEIRPDFGIYNGTAGAVIANIANCQRSRWLRIRNDSGSMTIKFTSSVKPNGASDWSVPAYSMVSLKADHTGTMYQV